MSGIYMKGLIINRKEISCDGCRIITLSEVILGDVPLTAHEGQVIYFSEQ